jgi:hypothetical protein
MARTYPSPNHRGRALRLLITLEAWEDDEAKLPEAVDRTIDPTRENGGAMALCEDQAGELVVVRESARRSEYWRLHPSR